uniref:GATA-type domain-containing protein n=1 Tax=Meloidogyne incognita TaxID=6306 RepID=A0A914NME9_MELIC
MDNNYYETSILEESLVNKKELLKENIENYKNKLLSSYWTEINLIGYKIELFGKQKVEYPKELKTKIIEIGNKISGNIEGNKRNCFNCGVKNVSQWEKYLKEHYLCHVCCNYKRRYAKFRSEEMWFKTNKNNASKFLSFSATQAKILRLLHS